MKRLVHTIAATAVASATLALATPAFAAYGGSGQLPAGNGQLPAGNAANGANGQLPAAGAAAPSPSPVVPLGTAATGLLLLGAGAFTLRRRQQEAR